MVSIRKPVNTQALSRGDNFLVCHRQAGSLGIWKAIEGHFSVAGAHKAAQTLILHANRWGHNEEFAIFKRDEIRFIGS